LSTAQNITILAPSNQAFTNLMQRNPKSASLTNNPTLLTGVLQYHVLSGKLASTDFKTTPQFATSMLMAPFANVTGGQKVELVKLNNTAAIFSGFKQMATVTTADVAFDGGLVHVIDTVLTVPAPPADTAIDTGLTSLAGALTAAQLVDGVSVLTDITVFAPTNAAFQAIGSGLGALQQQDLVNILEYHVLMNQLKFSTDLGASNQMTLTSLAGQNLTIRKENGQLFVNSAKVVISDILMSNGVVHVIDK
jgi:transforming growth factor-beta-induced protein